MMTFIKVVLVLVEIIAGLLLIGVILLQKTKGGGMGGAFGGGMGEALFGSQMGNMLTKVTVILAVVFLVNTTVLAMLGSRGSSDRAPAEKAGAAQAGMPSDGGGMNEVEPIIPDDPQQGGDAGPTTIPLSQDSGAASTVPSDVKPIEIPAE